ncbi:MAG: hypothetical protein Q8L85_08055 [Alphaproteobacteria bacterium]|nr:hypothetical protein [Alphaproteobacteria bacterium]
MLLPFWVGLILIGCQPHHATKSISHLAASEKQSKEKLLDYYIRQKMPNEVIQLTENCQDLQLLNYRGIAFDLTGAHSKAQEVYKIILVVDAKKTSILNNLALSYFLEGKNEEAKEVLGSCPHCANQKMLTNLK